MTLSAPIINTVGILLCLFHCQAGTITLSWSSANPGYDGGYWVMQDSDGGYTNYDMVRIVGTNNPEIVTNGVPPGVYYYATFSNQPPGSTQSFYVLAYSATAGKSPPSATNSFVIPLFPPANVTGVVTP